MFHVSCFIAAHFHDAQVSEVSGFQGQAYRGYLSEQHGRPDHATADCGCKVSPKSLFMLLFQLHH